MNACNREHRRDHRNRTELPESPTAEAKGLPLSLRSVEEEAQDKGKAAQMEGSLEPRSAEVNPQS